MITTVADAKISFISSESVRCIHKDLCSSRETILGAIERIQSILKAKMTVADRKQAIVESLEGIHGAIRAMKSELDALRKEYAAASDDDDLDFAANLANELDAVAEAAFDFVDSNERNLVCKDWDYVTLKRALGAYGHLN